MLLLKAKADKSDSTLKEGPRDLDVRRGSSLPNNRITQNMGEEVGILICGKTQKRKKKRETPLRVLIDGLFVVRES